MIRFRGVAAHALPKEGHARHRALATIAFFHLTPKGNEGTREDLYRQRAQVMVLVADAVRTHAEAKTPADRKAARTYLDGLLDRTSSHASCATDFHALLGAEPEAAKELLQLARRLCAKRP